MRARGKPNPMSVTVRFRNVLPLLIDLAYRSGAMDTYYAEVNIDPRPSPTGFGWTRKPDPEDEKPCWYLIVTFADRVVESRPFDVEEDNPALALNAALGFYR